MSLGSALERMSVSPTTESAMSGVSGHSDKGVEEDCSLHASFLTEAATLFNEMSQNIALNVTKYIR